ncbi:hypothetical protein Pyrfu_0282 [Pyrolobus fumarii 1A]|uniref:Uncharacterized protein n=1 Tax=Pyrolobus fumarii (strain DSM 11204 / 1A) TaxID=694429 RepID=G0EFB1_PYRF1|nr:hypothetical protein [Pyrolobus fumarii]AEM38154.1 hypothetical protein Pyrfu_0282 [Pyrolobus fumarii 1A]
MGIKRALGIALTLASLAVLAYSFYVGATRGMIGCVSLQATIEAKLGDEVYKCTIQGPTTCRASTIDEFSSKVSQLKGLTIGDVKGAQCNGEVPKDAIVTSVKVMKKPVDTPLAGATVAAWMGLLIGPWLAFGEAPAGLKARKG